MALSASGAVSLLMPEMCAAILVFTASVPARLLRRGNRCAPEVSAPRRPDVPRRNGQGQVQLDRQRDTSAAVFAHGRGLGVGRDVAMLAEATASVACTSPRAR